MENIVSSMPQIQQLQQIQQAMAANGAVSASGGNNMFMELIAQLMGGLGEEEGSFDFLSGLFQEEGEQKPLQDLAMLQELASALFMNPANTLNAEELGELFGGKDALAAINSDAFGVRPADQKVQQGILNAFADKAAAAGEEGDAFGEMLAKDIQSATWNHGGEAAEEDGSAMLMAQGRFGNAVAAVKRQLAGQDKANVEALDIDQLQSRMSRGIPMGFISEAKEPEEAEAPPLLDQLQNSITERLARGENEFVLKLKPAELGEITIRLLERGGKTVLSIATGSSQTARMLNGELEALRAAVRPMEVEVNEVTVQRPEGQEALSQQFDMAGQQFAGQHFAEQQFAEQHRQAANHRTAQPWWPGLAEEEEDQETAQILETQALDTYV